MLDIYRVSFIGHREIEKFRQVEEALEKVIYELVTTKEYVEFYVGINGDFDTMVASAIKRVQKQFGNHNTSLILVLPYRMKDIEYYEKFYDEVILPISSDTHFKSAICKRNEWLLENSELLIAYVVRKKGELINVLKKQRKYQKRYYSCVSKRYQSNR